MAREEITSYFSRPDLGQIWTIRLSKTAGLAGLIRGFWDCGLFKDGPKMGCEDRKLFFREPLTPATTETVARALQSIGEPRYLDFSRQSLLFYQPTSLSPTRYL